MVEYFDSNKHDNNRTSTEKKNKTKTTFKNTKGEKRKKNNKELSFIVFVY